jgi:hypothetical protein
MNDLISAHDRRFRNYGILLRITTLSLVRNLDLLAWLHEAKVKVGNKILLGVLGENEVI